MTEPAASSAWPGSWPVANPTAARMYVDIWLLAEFIWRTFTMHTQQMEELLAIVTGGQGSLPPADMTAVNKAVADLQSLTTT
jgi:hypothetical protein